MKSTLVRLIVTACVASALLPLAVLSPGPAIASSFDLQGAPVLFANGPCNQDIGEQASVGFSHRYDNVVTLGDVSVDAIVSLVSTTNLDSDDNYSDGVDNLIDYLDNSSSSFPNALRTQIDIASGPETIDIGEAVIRVAFVQAGTRTPLTLQNVIISVKDVDYSQFVEFAAISSYKLTSDTALQVATPTSDPSLVIAGSTRFFEPNGSSSSSTNEPNWVEVSYSQLSFVDIKIGSYKSGDVDFDIDFAAAGFTTATTTAAITAPSYTVTYDNNGSSETPPAPTTGSGTVSFAPASNRAGYTFIGWNTASDGTGLDIAAESNLTLSANVTLYAQWSTTTTPTSTSAPTPSTAPTNLDANGVPVLFANGPSDEDIGHGAGVGFSHRYDNVVQIGDVSVDAIVSLVSTTNLDCDDNYSDGTDNLIDYLDRSSSSFPNALRTQIDIASGPETIDIGEAVIRVAFVRAGTRTPLTLQNVMISVKDVDDSQYVEFAAISSYKLTSDTALQVATNTSDPSLVIAGSTRFFEPNGTGTTSTDERNWAEVTYSQLSFVDIKIGARIASSAFFDIDFAAVGFAAAITQPMAAPSYTVTYDNNGSSETPPAPTTGSGTVSFAPASNRAGYTFIGWNTASDGTGLDIAAESNLTLSSNVTLYAQWSVTPTTTPVSTNAPTTTSAPTSTPAPSATVSEAVSLPATGSDTSQLVLALLGLCLVGIGIASRKMRPRHDSNMRPMD